MIGLIQTSDLPPGFRFHPTDEELIMCYLRSQVTSKPCPVSIIPEVDIYKFDPWELPDKALFGENEWYFFTPRDRKYPNGVRPNRAAVSGYWKATGTDKAIHSGSKCVGVKKALVFYKGRPPKGIKTDWIMHEYRLNDQSRLLKPNYSQNGCMRLDDWVLCRIYKKKNLGRVSEIQISSTHQDSSIDSQTNYADGNLSEFPRACSSHNHLWEFECMGSFSQVRNANSSNVPFSNINDQETIIINNNPPSFWSGMDHEQRVDGVQLQQQSDAMKFQVNQTFLVNPNNELQ